MPTNFSLGSFIQALEDGYENELRASRNFSAKDVARIAQVAAEAFRNSNLNLFSCYELDGELGLWSTLQNYVQTKNPAFAVINRAVLDGNEGALAKAFIRAMKLAFLELHKKGALKRLLLVDPLPDEALRDLRVLQTTTAPPRPASPAPVVPAAPVESLEDCCTREFKELPSAVWKRKWLSDQRNRPVADRCAAQGRL